MTTIGGRPVRLLGTREAPGAIIDTWKALDQRDDDDAVGLVITFTAKYPDNEAQFYDDDLDLFARAYGVTPADDPAERFRVALEHDHQRAMERMSDGQFSQVWPPAGAPSLVGVVTEGDTRDGWLRVTWLPGGEVTVQGPAEWTRQVPADRSWASVLAWAQGAGFASIFPTNAP